MLKTQTILSTALCGAACLLLAACGQKGDLYIPREPEAAQRATLPRTLLPIKRTAPAQPGASAPDAPK